MTPHLAAGSQMSVLIFFLTIKWTILKLCSDTGRIKLVWLGLGWVITSPSRTLHTQAEPGGEDRGRGLESRCGDSYGIMLSWKRLAVCTLGFIGLHHTKHSQGRRIRGGSWWRGGGGSAAVLTVRYSRSSQLESMILPKLQALFGSVSFKRHLYIYLHYQMSPLRCFLCVLLGIYFAGLFFFYHYSRLLTATVVVI